MVRFLVFLVVLFSMFDVKAQMLFDDGKKTKTISEEAFELPKKQDEQKSQDEQGVTLEDLTRAASSSSNDIEKSLQKATTSSEKDKKKDADEDVENEDIFIPEGELYKLNEAPTVDGSKRGGQAFVEVDDEGRMKKSEKIFLFYDDFKITNYMTNTATCDVRFNILSNLDRKITQLDVKLVWPDITTTLSFSNVAPNTQTYYNYSLIGNGCYGMDIAPNIIVNRCRVKGLTSSECANKLVWLSK